MPTASLYVRLSKEARATNTSRDGMVADLHRLAADLGAEVCAVHVDDGLSGAIRDRPEFVAWLDDARTGRADLLLAWHGDRLTREGVNAAAMILDVIEGKDPTTGALVRSPVRFVSYDDRLDSEDRDAFRWRFVIAAEVARAERERIKARNLAAQRRLRESGRWRGGSPPFGYRVVPAPDGAGKALDVDPRESRAVRDAADFVLGGGSLYGAVQMLNAEGVKPRRARAWSLPSLRAVLTGDAILGRQTHKGGPVRGADGLPVEAWPPVLPLADVEALRALLAPSGDGSGQQRRRRAARLLSGLVECASCGGRMRVNRSRDVVRYACRGTSDGRGCSRPVTVNATLLDAHLEEEYLRRFGRLPEIRPVEAVREVSEVAQVEAALRDLSAAMIEPGADVPALAEKITALQARRADLASLPAEPTLALIPTGRTIREAWGASSVDERRDLLSDALEGPVVVEPGTPRRKGLEEARLDVPWRR